MRHNEELEQTAKYKILHFDTCYFHQHFTSYMPESYVCHRASLKDPVTRAVGIPNVGADDPGPAASVSIVADHNVIRAGSEDSSSDSSDDTSGDEAIDDDDDDDDDNDNDDTEDTASSVSSSDALQSRRARGDTPLTFSEFMRDENNRPRPGETASDIYSRAWRAGVGGDERSGTTRQVHANRQAQRDVERVIAAGNETRADRRRRQRAAFLHSRTYPANAQSPGTGPMPMEATTTSGTQSGTSGHMPAGSEMSALERLNASVRTERDSRSNANHSTASIYQSSGSARTRPTTVDMAAEWRAARASTQYNNNNGTTADVIIDHADLPPDYDIGGSISGPARTALVAMAAAPRYVASSADNDTPIANAQVGIETPESKPSTSNFQLLKPAARFAMTYHGKRTGSTNTTTSITLKFEPPISGRFILVKLWTPHKKASIDICNITARGYAGPRHFPAWEMR